MSMRQMRRNMKKPKVRTGCWGCIIVIFVLGSFASFGLVRMGADAKELPAFVAKINAQPAQERSVWTFAWVARLFSSDGEEISRDNFERQVRSIAGQYKPKTTEWIVMKNLVLERMINDVLLRDAAKDESIGVSRNDVEDEIERLIDFEQNRLRNQFLTEKDFLDHIREEHGSVQGYREDLKRRLHPHRSTIRREKIEIALRERILGGQSVEMADLMEIYRQPRVRHILVKYDRFYADKTAPTEKERGEADEKAKAEASKLLSELESPNANFEQLAKENSDDVLTATKGGDMGFVDSRIIGFQYGEEFAQEISSLKEGDIGGLVKGTQGYHVVRLEGREVNLPESFQDVRYQCQVCKDDETGVFVELTGSPEKAECSKCGRRPVKNVGENNGYECLKCGNTWTAGRELAQCPECEEMFLKPLWRQSERILDSFRVRKDQEAWGEFTSKLREKADVEVLDPELKAYRAQEDGRFDEAIRLYNEALDFAPGPRTCKECGSVAVARSGDGAGSYQCWRDNIHEVPETARREVRRLPQFLNMDSIYYQLGRIYEDKADRKQAIEHYWRAWKEGALEWQVVLPLTELLHHEGQTDEALSVLHKSKEFDLQPSERGQLADQLEALGDSVTAELERARAEKEREGAVGREGF